jgi:hypothetical protein
MFQISSVNGISCGVNSIGEVFCADSNIGSNPNWFKVVGNMKSVTINSDGTMFGLNGTNSLFYAKHFRHINQWIPFPGLIPAHVESVNAIVCGVNSTNGIFCSDNYTPSHRKWWHDDYTRQQVNLMKVRVADVGSITQCMLSCSRAGYTFSGVTIYARCYCDNDYTKYGTSAEAYAKGNSGELYGGDFTLNVWRAATYIGCYTDSSTARVFPYIAPNVAHASECIQHCSLAGYLYAGIEYGNQCFCGNSYSKAGTSIKCTLKTTDGYDVGGGSLALSVYQLQ